MTTTIKRYCTRLCAIFATCMILLGHSALAFSESLDDPFKADFDKALQGKTVAFLPLSMSFDLAQGWYAGLKSELEPLGVNVVVRDPNWNTGTAAQALATLIAEKPAVIVVHNPDVQTYVKLLQRAEKAGIHIIQINLGSRYPTAAYVGPNWVELGERAANQVIEQCKGKSNKIALVQAAASAAVTAYMQKGIDNVLAQHPEIQVVSSQPGDNDASKAKAITQTVLKQHPDLCGIVGFWDGMDIGTAAAVQEAGLTGKVYVVTSGGGEQKASCDQVKRGAFDYYINYDAPNQASTMVTLIEWLLQANQTAGVGKAAIYSKLKPITKENASVEGTCWSLIKS